MNRPFESPATVRDVARLAGVSPGTVSKALNGNGQLREATRAKVLAAAEELGLRRNLNARSLIEGRTWTVGVLTSESVGRFTIPVMLGAEDTLGAGQISVFLCDARGDRIREQHYIRNLLERRVDGIMVTGSRSDPRPSIGELPIPVVYALAQSDSPDDTSFVHDDEQGARLAIEHLVSIGRTRIVHITASTSHVAVTHRAEGVNTALDEAGLQLAGGVPLFGNWSERWGREAIGRLLREGVEFDAVFAASDQIARGVLDSLREAGRAVPDDVAVVGFDNWDVMAEAARPPLTTIDMNLSELGHASADALLQAFDGHPVEPGVRRMPCGLVARASTALA